MHATVLSDPPYAGTKVWLTREVDGGLLPRKAREELREWLGDNPALEDLQLIASELVTNAVTHGDAHWVRMTLRPEEEREKRYWRLTVADPGLSASGPTPRMPLLYEQRGRGLWVVDELTLGCWGTHRTREGECVVWARLPCRTVAA